MSDQNRFFRFLWRVNALLVLFAGITLGVVIARHYIEVFQLEKYVPPVPALGSAEPVPEAKPFYYLAALEPNQAFYATYVPGQNRRPWLSATDSDSERLLALMRNDGALPLPNGTIDINYVPKAVEQVNFLAVDGATGESHWLLSGFKHAITKYEVLTDTPKDPANAAVMTAVVMQVVEADTNKDGVLDYADKQTLYVYHPGEKTAAKLFSADAIVDQGLTRNATYVITYVNAGVYKVAIYEVPSFKFVREKTLPALPK